MIPPQAEAAALYRAVFTQPPYAETEADVERFARHWEATRARPGFRFVGLQHGARCVGMAYGWSWTHGSERDQKMRALLGPGAPNRAQLRSGRDPALALYRAEGFEVLARDIEVFPGQRFYFLGHRI